MAKTLLAVDDSVTMRKVLEITFSGEDFRVITANGSQSALGKLGENPQAFVVDTALGGEDGYALAKELRKRSPGAAIVMLASRYSPYDPTRGRDAGADDWADKPFDTQQLIDKVRKVLLAKEAGGAAVAPAPAPAAPPPAAAAAAPYRAPTPATATPIAAMPTAATPTAVAGKGTLPSGARTGTLVFGESGSPVPPSVSAAPRPAPAPAAAAAPVQAASPVVAAAVNGHLAGKLGDLGLTPQQADAVLALSREIVERVVWEVVPQLAETMIREEIARLTKD